MSLIHLAMEALSDTIQTEFRRLAREAQMSRLNGHDEDAVPEALEPVPAPVAYPTPPQPSLVDRIIAAAEAEWALDVVEPSGGKLNSADRVDQYIRGKLGLGWSTAEVGKGARPNIPYTRNGMFQWCGAFAAWVFGQVGLNATIRKKHMASTYRLWAWSNGNARRLKPEEIQPGDIFVMGPEGSTYGEHIGVCVKAHDDRLDAIEGNAVGLGPKGIRREGVIKQTRKFRKPGMSNREYCVMFGVRPLPEDYDA